MSTFIPEGDDDFVSVYGCVDDWDNPNGYDSKIPSPYTVAALDLTDSLPDPEDDECEEDDEFVLGDEWTTDLGGGDIVATHCACSGNDCNAAGKTEAVALGAAVFVAMTAMVL